LEDFQELATVLSGTKYPTLSLPTHQSYFGGLENSDNSHIEIDEIQIVDNTNTITTPTSSCS
ncbi:4967_t:CDS:1, partial [Ambispora gerdemannii]